MNHKRLTLFAGHYGSGKTNIAVNYALLLAGEGKGVCIADLDIVNLYFRTKDSAKVLENAGVTRLSPNLPTPMWICRHFLRKPTGWSPTNPLTALWTSAVTTGVLTPWAGMCPPLWRKTTTA
jgi:hypothetical protein